MFATEESFDDGRWHQVILVWDQQTQQARIYVDAQAQPLVFYDELFTYADAEQTVVDFSLYGEIDPSNGAPLILGADEYGIGYYDSYFRGTLDDVSLYRQAVPPDEISLITDRDQDSLPDIWEWNAFGSLERTGSEDEDGDGLTNLQEYQLGSDPNNYYSQGGALIVPSVTVAGGDQQTGAPGAFAAEPLVVEVRNSLNGVLLANAPVTFSSEDERDRLASGTSSGEPLSASLTVRTDGSGRVSHSQSSVFYQHSASPSTIGRVRVQAGTGPSAHFTLYNFDPFVPPVAPGALTASEFPDGSVTLTWQDNSDNETGFTIRKSTDGGQTWQTVAVTGPGVTTWTDTSSHDENTLYDVQADNDANPPGSPGPPGPSDPSPPAAPEEVDPEGDFDGDGVNNGDDLYPIDPNRSQDVPVTQLAPIDLSGTVNQGQYISQMALDDNGNIAFGFHTSYYYSANTSFRTYTWKNGVAGPAQTVPSMVTSSEKVVYRNPTAIDIQGQASGSQEVHYYEGPGSWQYIGFRWPGDGIFPPDPPYEDSKPGEVGDSKGYQPVDFTENGYCGWGWGWVDDPQYANWRRRTQGGIIAHGGATVIFDPYVADNNIPVASGVRVVNADFYPVEMNNQGWAIGALLEGDFRYRQVWDGQQLINFPSSYPEIINNQNQIVGYDLDQDWNPLDGYLWQNGIKTFIKDLLPLAYKNQITDIYVTRISDPGPDGTACLMLSASNLEGPAPGEWVNRHFLLKLRTDGDNEVSVLQADSVYSFYWDQPLGHGEINSHGMFTMCDYLLTTDSNGAMSTSAIKALLLLPVDITEVISDQITGNEANKLPTGKPYVGDDNNPMLMASRDGVKSHIAVKVSVPDSFASKFLVGVKKINSSTVTKAVPSVPAPQKTLIEFDAEEFYPADAQDQTNLYEVVAGYDSNGNGTLEAAEISLTFDKTPNVDSSPPHDKFRAVTKQFFVDSCNMVENASNVPGTGIAGELLNSFITGNAVPGATVSTFTLRSNEPGLTHPLGAVWSSANTAIAPQNTFQEGTDTSDKVEQSEFVSKLLDAKIESQKAEISTYFVLHPNETYHDFTFSYSGSDDFNTTDPGVLFSELGKAFGKVTISGEITARCQIVGTADLHTFNVIQMGYSGSFEDVYDFTYYGGASYYGPAMQAACAQTGYATLAAASRPSGRVFKNRVEFQSNANPLGSKIYDGAGQ